MDPYTEVAAWRILHRIETDGPQETKNLRSKANLDPKPMSDAIRNLERTGLIERENGQWHRTNKNKEVVFTMSQQVTY